MSDLGLDLLGQPVLQRSAFFPSPGVRRRLSRDWGPGPRALAIGCNPCDAGVDKDDPTSNWWNAWFRWYGFGGYDAMNLYPFVTSSPRECRTLVDAIETGRWDVRDELMFANLPELVVAAKRADQVFVCWGNIAWDHDLIEHVVEEIQSGVAPYPDLWCWGMTQNGAPKHPMARGKHRIDCHQHPILWRARA